MWRYLVDTNVVSQATKQQPNPNVATWFTSVNAEDCCLSIITIGEIQRGIALLEANGSTAKTQRLTTWLVKLQEDYSGRILDVTSSVMWSWANLSGRRVDFDSLIAATAAAHGLTVVTGNETDFTDTGVPVLNPFAEGLVATKD
ncbi:MAG: type II toxin-antitoxin system VapC family toxin [Propionibacteriaceae bacterium]|nr:type II toxin-antitoxin system VapC family toxin [Propionibacteriaceae bacterium]